MAACLEGRGMEQENTTKERERETKEGRTEAVVAVMVVVALIVHMLAVADVAGAVAASAEASAIIGIGHFCCRSCFCCGCRCHEEVVVHVNQRGSSCCHCRYCPRAHAADTLLVKAAAGLGYSV